VIVRVVLIVLVLVLTHNTPGIVEIVAGRGCVRRFLRVRFFFFFFDGKLETGIPAFARTRADGGLCLRLDLASHEWMEARWSVEFRCVDGDSGRGDMSGTEMDRQSGTRGSVRGLFFVSPCCIIGLMLTLATLPRGRETTCAYEPVV